MNPNNVSPAPPPAPMPQNNNQNPYEFIMNADHKPGRSFGGSQKQRIIIVAAGVVILIIIALIFMSILNSGVKSSTEQLISLAQQQNEIARIAGIGADKANSGTTKNLATTTELTVTSSQRETLALLEKDGHKVAQKELGLLRSATIDQQLENAEQSNTFDDVFSKIINQQLQSYQAELSAIYDGTPKITEKQLLKDSFDNVKLLLGSEENS